MSNNPGDPFVPPPFAEAARSTAGEPAFAVLELDVGPSERALLREAARLTGLSDPQEIVLVALRELVERRRFQSWVERLDLDPASLTEEPE